MSEASYPSTSALTRVFRTLLRTDLLARGSGRSGTPNRDGRKSGNHYTECLASASVADLHTSQPPIGLLTSVSERGSNQGPEGQDYIK